jgi:hypothetical protein
MRCVWVFEVACVLFRRVCVRCGFPLRRCRCFRALLVRFPCVRRVWRACAPLTGAPKRPVSTALQDHVVAPGKDHTSVRPWKPQLEAPRPSGCCGSPHCCRCRCCCSSYCRTPTARGVPAPGTRTVAEAGGVPTPAFSSSGLAVVPPARCCTCDHCCICCCGDLLLCYGSCVACCSYAASGIWGAVGVVTKRGFPSLCRGEPPDCCCCSPADSAESRECYWFMTVVPCTLPMALSWLGLVVAGVFGSVAQLCLAGCHNCHSRCLESAAVAALHSKKYTRCEVGRHNVVAFDAKLCPQAMRDVALATLASHAQGLGRSGGMRYLLGGGGARGGGVRGAL